MAGERNRIAAGLILIVVGLGLYLLQRFEGLQESVLFLLIGAAFLTVYLLKRAYGFLVPAGVLLGLGIGRSLRGALWRQDVEWTQLGLGLGFLMIYLIARVYEGRSHWWPLIPGGVLILVALPRIRVVADFLIDNWPLLLVLIGVLVLVGGLRLGRSASAGE